MQLKVKNNYDSDAILKNIRFKHIVLDNEIEIYLTNYETAIVILNGECSISVQNSEYRLKRKNVFEEKASAFYLSAHEKGTIKKISDNCEIAICHTYSIEKKKNILISKNDVKKQKRGKNGYERIVFDIIDESFDANSMLIGETLNFPGNWSSYPPHKHDVDNPPHELKLEELYFFKVSPENGFGFQRIYTKNGSLDETIIIKNDEITLIPMGYHPVCVMPGYQLYYLWILCGSQRKLTMNTDSDYKWLIE